MRGRILNIMLASGRGGVETMALRYHEALHAEGYDVMSIGHPKGVLADGLGGLRFSALDTLCNHDPIAALRIAQIVRSFRPDTILMHGNRATGLCLMPFVAGEARTVQVLHNRCYKPHLKRVDAAMCVSANVSQGLAEAYPEVRRIEVSNFAHLNARPVKLRPGRPPVIGAMGRLHEVKRFDLLIESAARLRDAGCDFTLRIAGEGPERAALEALVASLNLGDRVEFAGWIGDPQAFLSEIDLFVVSSRYESFGLVLVEAMAAGVPVVSADIDGPSTVLEGGRYGTLFRGGNADSLTEAVTAVFADWNSALRRARRAQGHALATYGFVAGQRRLTDALRQLHHEDSFWIEAPAAAPAYAVFAAE
ncbi:glycosyltransferase [Asticcacaulis solisilvae]|uniref:glycosyltransferase n=1 Tax=Asticcacaulis solisilvae TaxID=1217274 RepID=UPI003FD723DF